RFCIFRITTKERFQFLRREVRTGGRPIAMGYFYGRCQREEIHTGRVYLPHASKRSLVGCDWSHFRRLRKGIRSNGHTITTPGMSESKKQCTAGCCFYDDNGRKIGACGLPVCTHPHCDTFSTRPVPSPASLLSSHHHASNNKTTPSPRAGSDVTR